MVKCLKCNGTGVFKYVDDEIIHEVECEACEGTGIIEPKIPDFAKPVTEKKAINASEGME